MNSFIQSAFLASPMMTVTVIPILHASVTISKPSITLCPSCLHCYSTCSFMLCGCIITIHSLWPISRHNLIMNMEEMRNTTETSIRTAGLLVRFRCETSRQKVKTIGTGVSCAVRLKSYIQIRNKLTMHGLR